MPHAKPNLPTKTCVHCGRAFSWRKKWERCWASVRYCSDRCRREAKRTAKAEPSKPASGCSPKANRPSPN